MHIIETAFWCKQTTTKMETVSTRISYKTIHQVDFSYMSVSFESISIQIHLIVSRMDFQIAFVRSLIPHNLRSLRPRTFICACVRIVFSCMRRERKEANTYAFTSIHSLGMYFGFAILIFSLAESQQTISCFQFESHSFHSDFELGSS